MEDGLTEKTRRFYARLAGFLFLWLIVTGLTGALTTAHIVGSGTFAEKAQRVMLSERLYRIGLVSELVETLSALLLAFSLYVVLKPVNALIAQLAMFWRAGESFVGAVGMTGGFAQLHFYIAAQETPVELIRQIGTGTYLISALMFSIGSILFFRLFYQSPYIPKILSAFGIFASIVVTLMCLAILLFPEYRPTLEYGWAPMAIAEVVTGLWLMFGRLPA